MSLVIGPVWALFQQKNWVSVWHSWAFHHSRSHTILLIITQKVILQRTYSCPVPDSVEILQNKSNNVFITFLLVFRVHSSVVQWASLCGSSPVVLWSCFHSCALTFILLASTSSYRRIPKAKGYLGVPPLYLQCDKFLAPYGRVLQNWKICMLHPNISLFFIKSARFVFYI